MTAETIPGLPPRVTATLADDGPDGRVYRIEDQRGYTHVRDTIRVRKATGREMPDAGTGYIVEVWRREGWLRLLSGKLDAANYPPFGEAVRRAVAVLYGLEDHG